MQTVKQIVHDVASLLPEQATWDDVMYTLHARQFTERLIKCIETLTEFPHMGRPVPEAERESLVQRPKPVIF